MTETRITLAPDATRPNSIERFSDAATAQDIDVGGDVGGDAKADADFAAEFDADSHDVVASVLYRDTADAKEAVARQHLANARTELKELAREQTSVGTKEQMLAIRKTGACPDARFWFIASWVVVLIDVAFWYVASAQVFSF